MVPVRGAVLVGVFALLIAPSQAVPQRSAVTIYATDSENHRIVRIDDPDQPRVAVFEDDPTTRAFRHPSALAVDRFGRIYVADTGNHRIVRMDDLSGRGWMAFGSQGDGMGQFRSPQGIAVDRADRIYVADRDNNRIVRIGDMNGTGWVALGKYGKSRHQFFHPQDIAIDSKGAIHVADSGNQRIVRMSDMSGVGWIALGEEGKGPFFGPVKITFDPKGWIYVLDMYKFNAGARIVRIKSITGEFKWTTTLSVQGFETLGPEQGFRFSSLGGIAVTTHEEIYFSSSDRVLRVEDITGTGLKILQGRGAAECWTTLRPAPGVRPCPDRFSRPGAVAIDQSGRLLIADTLRNRIVRVNDMTGNGWVVLGEGVNQFVQPAGVAVDQTGRIYVVDSGNHRIVRMNNTKGDGWTTLGRLGSGAHQFDDPRAIALDELGRIYVADRLNRRIVRMEDMSGADWISFGPFDDFARIFLPYGVTLDSAGRIYIMDSHEGVYPDRAGQRRPRIVAIDDMSGRGWQEFGGFGSGFGKFRLVQGGITLDSLGRIYVADTGNNRIARINNLSGDGWITFKKKGLVNGKFSPYGIGVDSANRIYISSSDRIVRINDMSGAGWKFLGTDLKLKGFVPSWIAVVSSTK